MVPGVLVAQAFGRWGNWFNQELYGKPTHLPWGLEIEPEHWPTDKVYPAGTTFHPTFLYECIWNLGAFGLVIWADHRFKLGYGRVVALYVMAYTAGRAWIEYIRVDTVQLDDVYGLRFNVWVSIVLFLVALAYFIWSARRHPGRETEIYEPGRGPEPTTTDGADEAEETDEVDEAVDEPVDEPVDAPDATAEDPAPDR
jgi:prolipoprotein diacylglyceryl transferase